MVLTIIRALVDCQGFLFGISRIKEEQTMPHQFFGAFKLYGTFAVEAIYF
jgi:hypothetical protein